LEKRKTGRQSESQIGTYSGEKKGGFRKKKKGVPDTDPSVNWPPGPLFDSEKREERGKELFLGI